MQHTQQNGNVATAIAARVGWSVVLRDAGIAEDLLTRRSTPCPLCGGRTRFRFVDKGAGLWVCNSCSDDRYQSGFELLIRFRGTDAKEAASWIYRQYGGGGGGAPAAATWRPSPTASLTPEESARRVERMAQQLRECIPVRLGDPVDRYLRSRVGGLVKVPPGILLHRKLAYWQAPDTPGEKPRLLGHFSAMVTPGFDPSGRLVQLHKTYLTDDGKKANVDSVKKLDRGIGANSFALRIMPVHGDTLGVSEGIETGIRAHVLHGVPVWPCHSSTVLGNFVLPEALRGQVRRLIIFRDNDPDRQRPDGSIYNAGLHAANAASAAARRQGLVPVVVMPRETGMDMANL